MSFTGGEAPGAIEYPQSQNIYLVFVDNFSALKLVILWNKEPRHSRLYSFSSSIVANSTTVFLSRSNIAWLKILFLIIRPF